MQLPERKAEKLQKMKGLHWRIKKEKIVIPGEKFLPTSKQNKKLR